MPEKFVWIPIVFVCVLLSTAGCKQHSGMHPPIGNINAARADSPVLKRIMGNPVFMKADFYGGAQHFDSALYLLKKLLVEYSGDNELKSREYISDRIIWMYIQKGNYDTAHLYYNRLRTMAGNRFDTLGLIDALNFRTAGFLFHYLNRPDSAISCYLQSRRIYERLLGHRNTDVANCDGKIGDVYMFLKNDYYRAQNYYLKANQIFESLNDKNNKELYVRILYNLSSTNRLKGDYNKALQYALKTHEVAEETADSASMVYINGLIANIYASTGDYKNAIVYIRDAISKNNRQSVYLQIQQGDNYNKLSQFYWQTGNFEQSIEYSRKGLQVLHPLKNSSKVMYEANSYEHLGLSYMSLGDKRRALDYLQQALKLRIGYYGPFNAKVAYTYDLLGNFYDKALGNSDSALSYFQRSLISSTGNRLITGRYQNPAFTESVNREQLPNSLAYKAAVLKQNYVRDTTDTASLFASFATYALSDSLITYNRKTMDSELSRMEVSENYHHFYEQAIGAAYLCYQRTGESKFIDKVFQFIEKNNYLLLLEKVTESTLLNKAGVPDSIVYKERRLNDSLRNLQELFAIERRKPEPDTSKITALNKKIYGFMRRNEQLKIYLEQNYPAYFKLKFADFSGNLRDLQTYSLSEKTMVVQYFWGDRYVYVLGVKGNKTMLKRIDVNAGIAGWLKNFTEVLHTSNVTGDIEFENFKKSGFQIYSSLVKPMEALENTGEGSYRSLAVIPDGLLTKIAFEALVDSFTNGGPVNYKSLPYLVYKYNIHYEYSASLLMASGTDRQTRIVRNILGMSYSSAEEKDADTERNGFHPLPGSYKEMKVIASVRNAKIFTGAQATESNFKKYAPDYDILHLAIHGIADGKAGHDTRLIFRSELDSLNDGQLSADEIYSLNLKAQLAVLSACETGIGKTVPGEGVFSVARAFIYAGCPTVVISLWKVNDLSTVGLMKNFYRWLYREVPIGESLTRAKIDYLRTADGYTSHPGYWASFVAFGDMTPVRQPGRFLIPFLAILLASVLSGVAWWMVQRRSKRKIRRGRM